MNGWWREIADLVLPVGCAGCGRPRQGAWCDACRARLTRPGAVRPVLPRPLPPGLPPVWAAGAYRDELRAALLAHKERGALGLAAPLGDALAEAVRHALGAAPEDPGPEGVGVVRAVPRVADPGTAVRGAGGAVPGSMGAVTARSLWARSAVGGVGGVPGAVGAGTGPRAAPVLLVPVPSSRAAVAARGHDPARRMAARAAWRLRRTGTPVRMMPLLRQRRETADQAALSAPQRLANLTGALEAVRGAARLLADAPVVVVDDLLTTGASLAEAARAVRAAGGTVVAAAVLAGPPTAYDAVRGR